MRRVENNVKTKIPYRIIINQIKFQLAGVVRRV